MLSASVSNIDLFRTWKAEPELDMAWLMRRIRGLEPQSEAMLAGCAFHDALERLEADEAGSLAFGPYRFDFACDAVLVKPQVRELSVQKQYGDLLVRGRVDNVIGKEITDYKTTSQFDADRLMSGYQWRYYLDMMGCDTFCWQVFVMKEFGADGPADQFPDYTPVKSYTIRECHTLRQSRYPGMHEDCERLALEYLIAMSEVEVSA